MKVDLYKIEVSRGGDALRARLAAIVALPLEDRNLVRDGDTLRLDRVGTQTEELWYGDFICLRKDRPARAGIDTHAEDLVMRPGEEATEESAVLIDLRNEIALVQYNHRGPKAAAIAHYLSVAIGGDPVLVVGFDAVIDSAWMNQLQENDMCYAVEIGVVPSSLPAQFDTGNLSLTDAMRAIDRTGTERAKINLTFTEAGRPNMNFITRFNRFISSLHHGNRSDGVKTAKINMRNPDTEKREWIDMFAKRVSHIEEVASNAHKRKPVDARWRALGRARTALGVHIA